MLKASREGFDLQPGGDCGRLAVFPTNDRREMHLREQILLDGGQNGIGTDLTLNIERLVGIGRKRRRGDKHQRQQFKGAFHSATPTPWR